MTISEPNVPIFRFGVPGAVFVQVFVTDNVGRDVARGLRLVIAPIPAIAPIVKVVAITRLIYVRLQLVGTGKCTALA
ncbi:MAG: hypothetical protein DMG80_01515 [Acidobacteria bacterium]|nr:MAG: hypothetical protein DMG80_01515 [Acidobacteriota bacterium]